MARFGRRNDAKLITALAGGASIRGASRLTGISERTIFRRLEDSEFCQQVADARKEMLERAIATLTAVGTRAAKRLEKLLTAKSENVQLGAARTILETLVKARQGDDVDQRLKAIERNVQQRGMGRGYFSQFW